MAVESSNRSPSPMSARPSPNFANSMNQSERRSDSSVRRSINGGSLSKSPVVAHPTPWSFKSKAQSNGSAVCVRRNSFGGNEHKENNRPNAISKPVRGSKNFMSPTISAASKINASPRKKVLAERNEAVRTSASLSDGKFNFYGTSEEEELFREEMDKKEEGTFESKKRVTFDDDVVVLSPKEFSISDDFAEDEGIETCLSDFGKASAAIVSSSPLPVISPLDADPFAMPYDPKTNYLSPRPRFLRYQPLNLEETFSSETSSEGENGSTLEEVQSEEVSVQESSFSSSDVSVHTLQSEEASAESEALSKPRYFGIGRVVNWVLLFGLVALLASVIVVSHSPEDLVAPSSYQALLSKMYDEYRPYEAIAMAGLGGLLHKVRTGSMEAENRFIVSHFLNISEFECTDDDRFIFEATTMSFPGGEVETNMGSTSKGVAIFQGSKLPEQLIEVHDESEQIKQDHSEESELVEPFAISEPDLGVDHAEVEVQDELMEPDDSGELQRDPILEEQQSISDGTLKEDEAGVADLQDELMKPDDSEELQRDPIVEEQQSISDGTLKEDEAEAGVADLQELNSYTTLDESVNHEGLVNGASIPNVLVALICLTIAVISLVVSKKSAKSVSSEVPMKKAWDVMELDGETCASEMSSFSSYQKRSESEAQSKDSRKQSQRRNIRRESLASSSTEYTRDSSYGSFTTYSIMPTKHGDDEIVTPVRRSSRIRQKVTSP